MTERESRPALADLQRRFFELVTCAPGREALSADERRAPPAASWLRGGTERVVRGVEVYRTGYFVRLHDVLAEDFACTKALLGDQTFRRLASEYLAAHRSTSPSLRHAGERLPMFVRSHPLSERYPCLGDLARLEWARVEVFDRADVETVSMADLSKLPPSWTTEPLPLVPAFRMIEIDHAVDEAWTALDGRAHDADATRDARDASEAREETRLVVPKCERRAVIVWRREWRVYHRSATRAEASALRALLEGGNFAEACDAFAGEADPPRAALGALSQWAVDEMLARVPS